MKFFLNIFKRRQISLKKNAYFYPPPIQTFSIVKKTNLM